MVKVTYNDYRQEFGGSVIPDTHAFAVAAMEAAAFVEQQTMGRTADVPEPLAGHVRRAVCAVAEVVYKQSHDEEAPIASETVGPHTRSYAVTTRSAADRETEKKRRVRLYLAGTGLLYRGLR